LLRRVESKLARCVLCCGTLLSAATASCAAQEQYPKPLIHTPTDHPAQRVILISIDGMHALDMANWTAAHPHSALAELTARGVTYTNAHVPWADPAAGLVALATGGTPLTTGILGSDGYDRALSPAGSHCQTKGAPILIDQRIIDSRIEDSDAPAGRLDTSKMPRAPQHGCTPVFPHDLLRVNNIFEVMRAQGGRTAWAGESAALTDLYQGPSGHGLDEACGFKHVQGSFKDNVAASNASDEARVAALLHWIDGKDCAGRSNAPVPVLFGMSFASVRAAMAAKGMGYSDVTGTPSRGLEESFIFTDEAIGRIIQSLKDKHLYDSTWIIVTSPYGHAPIDLRKRRMIPIAELTAVANSIQPGLAAHVSGGDVGMIWLRDSSMTAAVVKAYGDRSAALGIQEIYSGAKLGLTLNPTDQDTRMPDIILQPELGVAWISPTDTAQATYGGMLDEDTHVALLVAGSQLTGRIDKTWVPTSQLAPLLLRALGIEKFDLQALHREHTPALPGIF
jgi:Type I phosphodiesterase / nucleotide pyrophosphatase